jgi:hypothetical protein
MWFITPENQILNSNSICHFWTEIRDQVYVYCIDGRGNTFMIARYLTTNEAKDYLNNLYNQLGKHETK